MYSYILKNKQLILCLIFFNLLFNYNISAQSKTDLSKYWDQKNYRPITIESVKNKFKNKDKLKKIEGIWQQDNKKIIAIEFNDNQKWWGFRFSKFVISDKSGDLKSGIKEATIHRTKYEDYFIIFEKSEIKLDGNYFTNFGTMKLLGENEIIVKIFRKKNQSILKEYKLIRIFP